MANGSGIIQRTRLQPVRSALVQPPGNQSFGQGVGIVYGMGAGATRISAITISFADVSGTYDMAAQSFTARLVVVNGFYPYSVLALPAVVNPPTTPDPFLGFELLYDVNVNGGSVAPIWLPTWFSGMVSDPGEPLTVICSQISFGSGGPPVGIVPQTILNMHADRYATRDLALSQGSILNDGLA